MTDERDDEAFEDEPRPPRPPGEGVRIIGAEEAASKMETGEAAGRRADAPRFGDVPPPPTGPRPAHRFPLPDDEVKSRSEDPPDLPHWTEPPTGEMPRIRPSAEDEEDLEAWSTLRRSPRWRDQRTDWEAPDFEDDALVADDEPRLGALADRDAEDDDYYFDDDPREARAPTRIRTRPEEAGPVDFGIEGAPERDIAVAVGTGVAFAVLAVLAFASGPVWAATLATAVVVLAAVEVFDVLRRAGYRPASLLGLVGTAALMIGAYQRGERAIPLVLFLTFVFTMLWYLVGVVKARPTISISATFLGLMWVGLLGSFATLMLRYPDREGIAFLVGAIVATVANDVGALFFGRRFGGSAMAPTISPNKTWEGLVGGTFLTFVVCLIVVREMSPWDLGTAFWLAAVVSVVAPLGDLCESMVKRDIGVKDMGTLLPGHGGILDRFDALLFVLPAVYYLVELLAVAS